MRPYIAMAAALIVAASADDAIAQQDNQRDRVEISQQNQQEEDNRATSQAEHQFIGFNCAVDCSSAEAGYAWAQNNSVENDGECPQSNSHPFREGCLIYARGGTARDTSNSVAAGRPISPDDFDDDDDDLPK